VSFGDDDPTFGDESVVVSVVNNRTSMEWARLSKPGRTENLTMRAVIRSTVRGSSSTRTVMERLEDLADVVQETLFNTTTLGQPVVSLGFDGERVGQIVSVAPDVMIEDDGTWSGICVIEAAFTADL
jgi:hypothetical protein